MAEKKIYSIDEAAKKLCGELMLGPSKKLGVIKEHFYAFAQEIRQEERKRCAHDICEIEGDKIDKSFAVMVCMMD